MTRHAAINEALAILKSAHIGVLATVSEGVPHTSLMACAFDEKNFNMIMATETGTRKFKNIAANPRVSLLIDTRLTDALQDSASIKAVSLSGLASVAPEAEKSKALALLATTNPKLAYFFSRPGISVIRIAVSSVLFLDGPVNSHVFSLEKEAQDE